jgi:hypothetical protein
MSQKHETNVEKWEVHVQMVGMVGKLGGGGGHVAKVTIWHGR